MLKQYTTTTPAALASSFKSTTRKTEWCMGECLVSLCFSVQRLDCVCVWVSVFVCAHVCLVCVCVCVCLHVCVCVCASVFKNNVTFHFMTDHSKMVWVCVCVCVRVRTRVCVCMLACIFLGMCLWCDVCMRVCVCVCICVFVYVRTNWWNLHSHRKKLLPYKNNSLHSVVQN